ncbi:MAG TPA: response regulator [Urbifossiella sp.]|jgi:CheY-like chemotaxis protein|nr:response regulator [Urbifossiella sp.]
MAETRPTVLIIDDTPAVLRTLRAMVGRHGFAALLAGSGDEGVQMYDQHRGEVVAVLLDVEMPGKDGPATLAELRLVSPDLPAVFITGDSPRYTPDVLEGLGAAVLMKPVDMDELGRWLRSVGQGPQGLTVFQ